MGSLHVPRLAWPRPRLRRGRRACAALAVAVLAALTLVNGTQHAAYGATEGPYGGTPAAVPGTVQAANYDSGGQGVAYNVTSTNGSANSYRSDGVDLETTADTQDTSTAGGAYDMGWTTPGQ
jgi:beta-glucosidase